MALSLHEAPLHALDLGRAEATQLPRTLQKGERLALALGKARTIFGSHGISLRWVATNFS